jgi:hypothetical protein
MTLEMSTAMWFVFAIVGLELAALGGRLWILSVINEHSGGRPERPQEHPGAPAAPPAA